MNCALRSSARSLLLGLSLLVTGCDGPVDKLTKVFDRAIAMLEGQSISWQETLKQLEVDLGDLARDLEEQAAEDADELVKQVGDEASALIGQVDQVLKDNVNNMAAIVNCQKDILRERVKIDLQNLKNRLLLRFKGQASAHIPYKPWVCTADPTSLNLNNLTKDVLTLNGIDLNQVDTDKPAVVIVQEDGSQRAVQEFYVSRVSNYQMTVGVRSLLTARVLDERSRQVIVRWKDQRVNENEINVTGARCGAAGEACCDRNSCHEGNNCESGICEACGLRNQPCCEHEVRSCTFGRCSEGRCRPCGNLGEQCCAGNQCAAEGSTCDIGTGTCVAGKIAVNTIKVAVQTSCRDKAGTDDDVWFGFDGVSFALDNPGDDREKCNLDTYLLNAAGKNLFYRSGMPVGIMLQKSSDGDSGGWFVDWIDVQVNGGETRRFTVDRWLEDNTLRWYGDLTIR